MIDLRRWPHADDLLDAALDRPAAERGAWLREATRGDADLRAALEAVLDEMDVSDTFLRPAGALTGPLGEDLARSAGSAPARLEIGARFGGYEIRGVLGAGGMGEVYRARDARLGREVALKVLPAHAAADPVRHDRLVREARMLASLSHPGIGAIFGFEEQGGIAALVLELVEGPTLAERLGRGRLPFDEAIDVATGIAEALEAAHARGVVHRDLKPANVKIAPGGVVKVLDFGIAKAIEDADAPSAVDPADAAGRARGQTFTTAAHAPGAVIGTVAYMSPERLRGQRADQRADVWAFGCVLFEMLAGTRAFDGETPTDVIARALEREPEYSRLPVGTPASIVRLLQRTLRKDPARRLGYIGDAVLELEDARAELADTGDPVPIPRQLRRRTTRLTVAALVAGAAIGGGLVWQLMQPTPPRVAHLAVPIPDADSLVSGELPGLAVSPDGRTVVYRAQRDGAIVLVRRSLDEPAEIVLPGSTNGASPFFSPDGAWIGFTSDTAVMKIASGGGSAAVKVAEAPGGARASWTDDGHILFSMGTTRVLHRVPASGGAPTAVTTLDEAGGDLSHEGPFALPGGRTALLTVVRAAASYVGVADVETGTVRVLVEGRQPQLTDTGHVIFGRGDAVWAAPFDASRRALAAEPALVLEGVEVGALNGTPHFAVGPSGTLVYMPRRPALDLRTLVWVSRGGEETTLPIAPRPYTRASLSPDGNRIALAVAGPENRDIWIHDLTRDTTMRLTSDPSIDTAPIWTPDGQQVAFRSERDGGDVFLVPADGSGAPVRLTRSDGPARPAHTPYAFTPDGRALLFAELRSYSDQGIARVSLDAPLESTVVLDGRFAEARPALSPDGRWLAYQSDETGRFEIYLRPYPDVNARRLAVSASGGSSAQWSRDGRELFYFDGTSMVAVTVATSGPDPVGRPRVLFEAARYNQRLGPVYDVTPDGQRFLFSREGAPGAGPVRRADLRLVEHWTQTLRRD